MRRSLLVAVLPAALVLAVTFMLSPSRADEPQQGRKLAWAIVIHGGAGGSAPAQMPAQPSAREELLASYLKTGRDMLSKGGSAIEVCEKIVNMFEDSGKFNTGKGASATGPGTYSLDASIMDGKTLGFGAVAGVKTIKNPISTARVLMEKTDHCMLIGPGAEKFAEEKGLEIVPPSYFNATKGKKDELGDGFLSEEHGTVGCVCLDDKGNLAAATSTGGKGKVMPGRVGDTPICGAGTYANNKTCAVSGTGTGEHFIRNNVAHTVSALMEYKGLTAQKAADEVVFNILKKGTGGIIVVAHTGEMAAPFNGGAMARGMADSTGRFEIGLGKEVRTNMGK